MSTWAQKFQQVNNADSNQPSNQNPDQGAFNSAVQKTGAYNGFLGGILKGVASPLLNVAETGAEGINAGGQMIGDMLQGKSLQQASQQPYQTKFVSPNESKVLSSPNDTTVPITGTPLSSQALGEGAKEGVGADMALSEAKGLAGIPGAIKSIPTMAKVVTGKGLWDDILNAAQNPVPYANVEKTAIANTEGAMAPIKQALAQILKENAPEAGGDINSPLQYTGQEAAKKSASAGQLSKFNSANPNDPQTLATRAFRDALSKEAQSANSDTLPQAYKNYQTHQTIVKYAPKVATALGVGGGATLGGTLLFNLLKGLIGNGSSANTDTSGQ